MGLFFKQIINAGLLIVFFSGCAAFPNKAVVENDDSRVLIPASRQLQAIALEENDQFLDAVAYWKKTGNIIETKIASLTEELKQISKKYSQRGVSFYKEKKEHEALLIFLEALRYYPDNAVALDYLKNRYEPGRFILYSVKPTDTFAIIAETVYGSPTYEFVIARFSDAGREEDLQEGLLITLPQLDSYFSQPLKDFRKNLKEARKHFKAGDYQKALPVALTIQDDHPKNEEASYIINRSLLEIAETQRSELKFDAAIRTLSRVSPSFKNVAPLIEEIKTQQQEYLISEYQRTNTELFERGKTYYDNKQYRRALEAFLKVSDDFEGREEIIADTRQKMQIEADYHFKEGIKLFVEENLTAAIAQWQKTLELVPSHSEAITSIEKARKLLDKVKKIN